MKKVNISVLFSGEVQDDTDLSKVILKLDCKNVLVCTLADEQTVVGSVDFYGTDDVELIAE